MKRVAKALIFDNQDHILVLTRNVTHPRFPGHLDFPGGEVELNELPHFAVEREIKEETSLDLPQTQLELVVDTQITESLNHTLFISKIDLTRPAITLSWEHAKYQWLTLDELVSTPYPPGVDDYYITAINYLRHRQAN